MKAKKLRYKFDKKNHYHSLGGTPLYGVTTALGVIAKPALIPWASNKCAESIKSEWKIGKAYTKKERDEIIERGRLAHKGKKQAGADVGTLVHKAIEKWIKSGCNEELPIATWCGKDLQATKMFMKFVEWKIENNVEFITSEKNTYSEVHWFGGIVDFVCIIKGKRYVGDIKTSNGIFPENFLQMGAYDICLQEQGNPKADGYIIINLLKGGYKKDGTAKECKIRIKKFNNTEKYQKLFIHALELYKGLKTMKWNNYY